MALFLPVLRLLMLFLNVYESYKTLKPPTPSSRNPARPSVRAMTQRKRDMKGCLAVWIVWVSLALYERVLENLVSLFIPFYDEFKSLVLLFLLVTRARGAEPIYLHLIRPIIKPHTRTLDATLELMLMVGDFLIALSTYPVQLVLQWWERRFARFFAPSEPEDSSDESSNEVSTDVSSTFFASSGQQPIPSARGGNIRNLRKSNNEISNETRRPYISPGTHHKRGFSQESLSQDPNRNAPESSVKRPSSSRQSSRSQTLTTADNNNGENSTSPPPIWYPHNAFHPDNGIGVTQADLRPLVSVDVTAQVPILAEQQTDEWRQYPAFPSAYPPTPIATTSRLLPSALGLTPSIYPPIPEEMNSQQDFCRSLLPPRGPLNPSPAGDLSDQYNRPGISPFLASDADDSLSISTDGCGNEDEDEFNVTLKTPLQLNGSIRSRPRPTLIVSPPPIISAASSNFSVASRSSALTTVDNGSPLRTDTWSDSSLSCAALNQNPASIIGKKRTHPRAAKARARKAEELRDYESSDLRPSSSSHERKSITTYPQPQALKRLESVSASDAPESVDTSSSSERHQDNDYRERSAPKEKRRKVAKFLPMRSANSPPPVRNKASRIGSASRMRTYATTKSLQTRADGRDVPSPPTKRRSARLKTGDIAHTEGGRSRTNGETRTESLGRFDE